MSTATTPQPLTFLTEDGETYVVQPGEHVKLHSDASAPLEYFGPATEMRGSKRGKYMVEKRSSSGRTLKAPRYVRADEVLPLNDKTRIRERGRLFVNEEREVA